MTRLTAQQIENLPEWMPIEGFEGLYEVNCKEGLVRNSRTFRILKPNLNLSGYPFIGLHKDSKTHTKTVHRIVANSAYHHYGISTNRFDVCHLDETRTNNYIGNLVLGSRKGKKGYWLGKNRSAETRKKISEALNGKPNIKLSKRVGAYKNNKLIMVFQSTAEAGRNGFNQCNVSACCTGKLRTHRGYVWRFLDTPTALAV